MSKDSNEVRIEGTCLRVAFHVDRYWKFQVPDLDRAFNSYEDMKAAIERNSKHAETAKRRKVSIPFVNEKGKKGIVTGVHAGHGGLISKTKTDRWNKAYMDTPLVARAMAEMRRLQSDMSRVKVLLNKHLLNDDGYRSFCPEMHEDEVKRIESVFNEAMKIANKPLEEALVGIDPEDEIEL